MKQEVLKRFREKFGKWILTDPDNQIEQFLSEALDAQREEVIKEVEKIIEIKGKEINQRGPIMNKKDVYINQGRAYGYTEALGEMRLALKELKGKAQ